MPVWLRRFNLQKINEFVKKENEAVKKAQQQNTSPTSNEVSRPNIKTDKSSYSFKK